MATTTQASIVADSLHQVAADLEAEADTADRDGQARPGRPGPAVLRAIAAAHEQAAAAIAMRVGQYAGQPASPPRP